MILVNDHGAVRELRLNRPPVNALSSELVVGLRQAVETAPLGGMRAVVVSGSPGRFCAGLDIPSLLPLDEPAITAFWHDFYGLLRALACSPIPIVAAITGHAPAGGTVLPLFCDYRIAAEGDWKIGLNEVRVGLAIPPVIFGALVRQVGARQAERLGVAGLWVSPRAAAEVGLVDELVPVEKVVERAIQWCQELLAIPSHAMTATRRQARTDLARLFERVLDEEIQEVVADWCSDKAQEALRAVSARLGKKTSA